MIINPSAHTIVPSRNSFQSRAIGRRRKALSIPGDKQFWSGISKVLFSSVLFLLVSFFWLGSSVQRVITEIEKERISYEAIVNANILLRAEKAQVFSPESVGALAGGQLAIHLPASGQYCKF
ncbi:MAG: hypothetical protein U9R57_00525 [Thermodesulfobacteriota bacterium]|nr:hypothetical protein [Thermodesulfobacteriota bacterium]